MGGQIPAAVLFGHGREVPLPHAGPTLFDKIYIGGYVIVLYANGIDTMPLQSK